MDFNVEFEWDEEKNKKNIKKHGISFEQAITVFLDPNVLTVPDPYSDEDRWDAIGFVGTILFVVYTERKDNIIRIISARKATKEEIHEYEKNLYGQT